MGWSTSKPSGVTWSSVVKTGTIKNNYYEYWGETSIARGANNTVYVRVVLCARLYSYEYRLTAPSPEMKASIKGAGASSWTESSVYAAARPAFGATVTVKTLYWTGTAAYNASCTVQASNTSDYTSSATLKAPNYTTKHTITYNGNGTDVSQSTTQSKLYGSSVTLYGCSWVKTGYHFVKWNTKADGTGTSYNSGATYSTNANLTLYAIWEINTYAVTYDANGGEGATEAQTKTYGIDLPLQQCGFSYSGHAFNHWNTKADDSGTRYMAGETYTGNEELTLYAIWDGTWPVIYDGNGATGGGTASQTKVEDQALTLQSNGFLRDKHTFVEWNTASDGTGTSYSPGDTYEDNAALTLYAIWLKNNIPVFFNDDGTIRQVERAFYNDDGVIRECSLYYNDDGTIRPIT